MNESAVPPLLGPFSQRGVTLRNRVAVSPMCQYLAENGVVTDWHYRHHARFALGGVGADMVEATAVSPEGRITHGCTGLWDDGQVAGLARIAAMCAEFGVVPAIQLAHAGRKASRRRPVDGSGAIEPGDAEPAWEVIGPSAVAAGEGWLVPREMERGDIDRLLGDWKSAARRARAAGFEIVEIHGAHGYLIHEFFSPAANRRSDGYGGSRANRMRFALEVAEAVRGEWPDDRPVWFRVSAVDGAGIEIEDTIELARALKARGIDLIDCSSGGLSDHPLMRRRHPGAGFQVPYAAAIRRGADIATMAVGFITEGVHANSVIAEGAADLVAIAREFMADPNWVYRAGLDLGHAGAHGVLPEPYSFYLERRAALER